MQRMLILINKLEEGFLVQAQRKISVVGKIIYIISKRNFDRK